MSLKRNIIQQIIKFSSISLLPDRTSCKIISAEKVNITSNIFKVSLLKVEILAVENEIIPERYLRNMKTISFSDQAKLLKAHICIVGLGGLGGVVLENLARIGIGNLKLIDGDVFEYTNLNRQLLSSEQRIGKFKTNTAVKHVNKINPAIVVSSFNQYLNAQNSHSIIDGCEITVDCLDNIKTRFLLETESKKKNIPMVSAAIAGLAGHVTTIFPKDKGLKLIFGNKINEVKNTGVEKTIGCLPQSVNIIASIQSNEVIKIILDKKTLRKKLLVVDIEDYTFEILELEKSINFLTP